MGAVQRFEQSLSAAEKRIWKKLISPLAVQEYLDSIPYRSEEVYHGARAALSDRRANCFDGALLAAAVLRRLGQPPLLLQLVAYRDDEHLLAIFRRRGHFGAVGKSNFVGLRYREPIYRSLRELALSYFPVYYNLDGEKSLRGYCRPLDLRTFDRFDWMGTDGASAPLLRRLDQLARVPLLTPSMARALAPLDERTFRTNMIGVNLRGVFKPGVDCV
jgi:hypothetical protein